jgi:hypothetical protein
MHFSLPDDFHRLFRYLPQFVLVGQWKHWEKRVSQLLKDSDVSPYRQHITRQYHWLELALNQISNMPDRGAGRRKLSLEQFSALLFAAMVVEVHSRLSRTGKNTLEGRIADASQSPTGFSSLYQEMHTALRLLEEGYEVQFPDLEGRDRFDIGFSKGPIKGAIECKAVSPDAGRKVHRRHFYQFIELVNEDLLEHAHKGLNDVVLIRLQNRLPSNVEEQKELAFAACVALNSGSKVDGSFFSVQREPFDKELRGHFNSGHERFYKACRSAYGPNCHVAGPVLERGAGLVVMLSLREDDASKPLLDALREAAVQLSGRAPSIIAVQYDDLEPIDLDSEGVRKQAMLLSNATFEHYGAHHVAGIAFSVYRGFEFVRGKVGRRSMAVVNHRCLMKYPELPLLHGEWEHVPLDSLLYRRASKILTPMR